MPRYFFDIRTKEETKDLFKDLKIENEKEIMKLQGEYPVIFITFKNEKYLSYKDFIDGIKMLLSNLYKEHEYLLVSNKFMNIKLTSLSEAKKAISNLNENTLSSQSEWSSYQIFVYCSKTIEYSMTGYPSLKPAIVKNTIGKLAINKFFKEGYMKHNLHTDVPGSPVIENKSSFIVDTFG